MTTAIEQNIQLHRSHIDTVEPGQPAVINSVLTEWQGVNQGDLCLAVCSSPPGGYTKVEQKNLQKQLVPEAGAGSHHRLSTLKNVEMWVPVGWRVDLGSWESLEGPWFRCTDEITVRHEPGHAHRHGPVTIEPGIGILCGYQREYDKELARERRVAD